MYLAVQGREDLRLDQRLMQLLQLSNGLLGHRGGQHMRPLTVVPLGPRMGLISWVEGTVPLYGVVKAWQRRQLLGAGEHCHHLPWSARLGIPVSSSASSDCHLGSRTCKRLLKRFSSECCCHPHSIPVLVHDQIGALHLQAVLKVLAWMRSFRGPRKLLRPSLALHWR